MLKSSSKLLGDGCKVADDNIPNSGKMYHPNDTWGAARADGSAGMIPSIFKISGKTSGLINADRALTWYGSY